MHLVDNKSYTECLSVCSSCAFALFVCDSADERFLLFLFYDICRVQVHHLIYFVSRYQEYQQGDGKE